MARTSRAEWQKRVERWCDSGLSAKEYAAQTGLKASTLSYWKWRLGSEQRVSTPETPVHKRERPSASKRSATASSAPRFVEVRIYDGVRYARNQRTGLSRFLRDRRLPLDNNISERELRRQAVGRKNWLFVGSDDGARSNAVFTSLLASCRMHDIEPWSYLRDLLCLLPSHPKHCVLELAPAYWRATCERPDIHQRLEHHHYRAAVLRLQP